MAKADRAGAGTKDAEGEVLAKIAEDVGRLVGTTERKASEWMRERKNLVNRLTRVRDGAAWLLAELENKGASAVDAVGSAIRRPQSAPKGKTKAGARHKPVDAETRAQRLVVEKQRSKQAAHTKASPSVRKKVARSTKMPARRG